MNGITGGRNVGGRTSRKDFFSEKTTPKALTQTGAIEILIGLGVNVKID
jgi:hypothetical protein